MNAKVNFENMIVDREAIITSLQLAQCYLESLSDMLLQAEAKYEGSNHEYDENIRSSVAFLTVCESLAMMAFQKIEKSNLQTTESNKISTKIYGLAVGINEVINFRTNIKEACGVLYGLSYVAKYLQDEINTILHPIEFKSA